MQGKPISLFLKLFNKFNKTLAIIYQPLFNADVLVDRFNLAYIEQSDQGHDLYSIGNTSTKLLLLRYLFHFNLLNFFMSVNILNQVSILYGDP